VTHRYVSAGKSAGPDGVSCGDVKHRRDAKDHKVLPLTEIAFFDPAVSDIDTLIAGLRQNIEPYLLDHRTPALAQIATALHGRERRAAAIHIIAHGQPGEVTFSAGAVSLETFSAYADDLVNIGTSLGNSGELLLWSCDSARGRTWRSRGTGRLFEPNIGARATDGRRDR
jgi:hypothetical protein